MTRRLLLLAGTTLLVVLLTEGVLSLFWQRSWRTLLGSPGLPSLPREASEADRFAAAARNPGPYGVHPDPRVGYVLKGEAEFEVKGGRVRSTALGLRARPGPLPPGAYRIAVLGDSVAFGWGLDDDQTLAHQLETLLAAATGPSGEPVACFTVAVPGWNLRNSVFFLQDHFSELRPDLVLFLDVANDLDDTDGVLETGFRRNALDPLAPDPWVGVKDNYRFLLGVDARLRQDERALSMETVGPAVLAANLSRESELRLEEMARTLGDLQEFLERQGATLLLVPYEQHPVHVALRAQLAAAGIAVPEIPLLETILPRDTLEDDPHPSATTVHAFACWIAGDLMRRGFLRAPAYRPLEDLPDGYAERRAPARSDAEILAACREAERAAHASLGARIDLESGQGVRQIYGGIHADGTMGPRLLALLGPGGAQLRVSLAPLEGRPELYPLAVRVEVDGESVGTLEVAAAPSESRFDLGDLPRTRPVEVRLIAPSWAAHTAANTPVIASCRFLSLAREER